LVNLSIIYPSTEIHSVFGFARILPVNLATRANSRQNDEDTLMTDISALQPRPLILADEGLSNRQIAKVLGVHPSTVDRDVTAANAAPDAANAAPQSKPFTLSPMRPHHVSSNEQP
jgi:hypothetical protein